MSREKLMYIHTIQFLPRREERMVCKMNRTHGLDQYSIRRSSRKVMGAKSASNDLAQHGPTSLHQSEQLFQYKHNPPVISVRGYETSTTLLNT